MGIPTPCSPRDTVRVGATPTPTPTPTPDQARVDGFLGTFRATLAAMPEAELDTYREALAVQVSDVDKRLAQQVALLYYI